MPRFNPKTTKQNAAIFGLGSKRGLAHDDLRDLCSDVTKGRTDQISKISFEEANEMIHQLGGRPFPAFAGSRRTQNYHRQKAGIESIVTKQHLAKMEKEWFAKPTRTAVGLREFCNRMLKDANGNPLDKPRTTKECNKVIEGIKAMNRRDNIFQFPKGKEAA